MATEFENAFKITKAVPQGDKSFTITLRCNNTREMYEIGYTAKVKDMYEVPSGFRAEMAMNFDKLVQKFLSKLPVVG